MSERKRATGFVLMDAAFAADAKFVRLARKATSPHDYAAAVGVFWLLLGDARRAKSPVVDWDDYEEYDQEIDQLKAAHLLQEDGFDPEVFERWAPAYRSVSERTGGTDGYGRVPSGTKSTNTSGQVKSGPFSSNGVGGVGEGEPVSFIRSPKRSSFQPDYADIERQQRESLEDAIRKTAEREAK